VALSGNIVVAAAMTLTADPIGSGATVSVPLPFSFAMSLTDGTTANKANRIYSKRLTLSASPTDIDLAGSLVDVYGNALAFVEVVGILVKNNSSVATEDVRIGGSGNGLGGWISAVTESNIIGPGGVFCIINPADPAYQVVGGTGDILQVVADNGTPTADVMILGRST